jgi:hypothetical protein
VYACVLLLSWAHVLARACDVMCARARVALLRIRPSCSVCRTISKV